MESRILRAAVLAAGAGAAAALLLNTLRPTPDDEPRTGSIEVEADALSPERRDALLDELEAQL